MTDKTREAFEAWYKNTPLTTTGENENYFGYTKESLQWAYEAGYQAATKQSKERERELVTALKHCLAGYELFEKWENARPDSFFELDAFTGQSFANLSMAMHIARNSLKQYERGVGND